MSSILDALKKAERESTTDRGTDTPLPMLPSPSPYRRRRPRRWWVPIGLVAVLAVSGLAVWTLRRPEATRPEASVAVAPPSARTRDSAPPPPVAAVPAPPVTVAGKRPVSPARPPGAETSPRRKGQTADPPEMASPPPPVQPASPQPMAAAVPPKPAVPPAPVPPVQTRQTVAAPQPEPDRVPAVAPTPPPAETVTATVRGETEPPDTEKSFRTDPRIDLQALVWAPDAAARFVVINNRLIKEGGSIDTISVVKINPDDVLLAEGSERWHIAFKVR